MFRDSSEASSSPAPLLLCFSHLRWSFVWQRPQQLMSRFAGRYRVVFVEEPALAADDAPSMLSKRVTDGVTVLTPLIAKRRFAPGFGGGVNSEIRALLTEWLAWQDTGDRPVVWYWTPLALGACPEALSSALVVFDAMDELSAFRFASEDLIRQEALLMRWADLVFTGGPSLYRARRERHPRVSCFPSGVDATHYRQAASGRERPKARGTRRSLQLGYVGVLDERIDLDLIAGIADLRPNWTISLVGPLAKIALDDIPARKNIHLHGMQPYETLPGFMATFDIGILPFADNEATRFISPTKTLEYLAAELPVVSTAVRDVVELYGDCVAIASGPEAFVAAAEELAWENQASHRRRRDRAEAHLARHEWDTIVSAMIDRIEAFGAPALLPSGMPMDVATASVAD